MKKPPKTKRPTTLHQIIDTGQSYRQISALIAALPKTPSRKVKPLDWKPRKKNPEAVPKEIPTPISDENLVLLTVEEKVREFVPADFAKALETRLHLAVGQACLLKQKFIQIRDGDLQVFTLDNIRRHAAAMVDHYDELQELCTIFLAEHRQMHWHPSLMTLRKTCQHKNASPNKLFSSTKYFGMSGHWNVCDDCGILVPSKRKSPKKKRKPTRSKPSK